MHVFTLKQWFVFKNSFFLPDKDFNQTLDPSEKVNIEVEGTGKWRLEQFLQVSGQRKCLCVRFYLIHFCMILCFYM